MPNVYIFTTALPKNDNKHRKRQKFTDTYLVSMKSILPCSMFTSCSSRCIRVTCLSF